jgi:hypothetical protein
LKCDPYCKVLGGQKLNPAVVLGSGVCGRHWGLDSVIREDTRWLNSGGFRKGSRHTEALCFLPCDAGTASGPCQQEGHHKMWPLDLAPPQLRVK